MLQSKQIIFLYIVSLITIESLPSSDSMGSQLGLTILRQNLQNSENVQMNMLSLIKKDPSESELEQRMQKELALFAEKKNQYTSSKLIPNSATPIMVNSQQKEVLLSKLLSTFNQQPSVQLPVLTTRPASAHVKSVIKKTKDTPNYMKETKSFTQKKEQQKNMLTSRREDRFAFLYQPKTNIRCSSVGGVRESLKN